MKLVVQEDLVKAQGIQIQELEKSVKYPNKNFQEATKQYNGLVEVFAARESAVNQTLADHQSQVCWTMQRV
jgi:hypothetical protein